MNCPGCGAPDDQGCRKDCSEVTKLFANTFIECDICRAKPGSPLLCKSCIHNRAIIAELTLKLRRIYREVEFYG